MENPAPATAVAVTQEFLTLILRGLSAPPMEAELIAAQAANLLLRPATAEAG